MVYSNRLVACVKVNGQILREERDTVTIPFGSEYSLYLKNLNSVRVQVKVSIDSQDATEGTWLVIQPNSSIELERFIKGGNLSRGNRFKFIERTAKIEKHRGIGGEDGLIRIEYQTEKVIPKPVHIPVIYDYTFRPYYWWPAYLPWGSPYVYQGVTYLCNNAPANLNVSSQNADMSSVNGFTTNTTTTGSAGLPGSEVQCFNSSLGSAESGSVKTMAMNFTKSSAGVRGQSRSLKANMMRSVDIAETSLNDAGITVAGSESDQKFQWTSSFLVHETSDVIVLKLRGSVGGAKVVKAVTVKTKRECGTCGKKNKSSVKFCAECGTSLVLI